MRWSRGLGVTYRSRDLAGAFDVVICLFNKELNNQPAFESPFNFLKLPSNVSSLDALAEGFEVKRSNIDILFSVASGPLSGAGGIMFLAS